MCCPAECTCTCQCCRGQVEKYVNFDKEGANTSSEPEQTMVRLSTKNMLTLLRVVQSLENFWSNQYYKVDLQSDYKTISAALNSEEIMDLAPQIMDSITAGYRRAVSTLSQDEASSALSPKSITSFSGDSLRCECTDCELLPWNKLQQLEAHQWLHKFSENTHCNICYRRFFVQHTMLSYVSRRNIRNETGELQENVSYKQLLTKQKQSEQPSRPALKIEQLHLRLPPTNLLDFVDETEICTRPAPPARKRSTQVKCVECNYVYKYSFSYQLHMKKHHVEPAESRRWHCASCWRVYRTRRIYLKHLRRVRSACRIRLRRFNCCKLTFLLEGSLRNHAAKAHPKVYKCWVCKAPSPRSMCPVHMEEAANNRRKLIMLRSQLRQPKKPEKATCKYCSKTFYNAGTLAMHIKGVHLKKKDFICHVCGRGFSYQNFMLRHIAAVHDMEFTAYCELCDVTLTDRSNYVRHCQSLVHMKNLKIRGQLPADADLKDKQWYCNICDRQLATSASYYVHCKSKGHKRNKIQLDATGNKGYKPKKRYFCESCDLEFANPQSYHTHKKSKKHLTKIGQPLSDQYKKWYCSSCKHQLCSTYTYLAHLKTQKHLMLAKQATGSQAKETDMIS